MDQCIGKILDNRYEILEVVGTGGMAVVYKAKCHRLNRMVAVKVLKPELAQDEELRRRFHDESQAVAMLSHPNIMAVYDVSKSSDMEYIVMELLDGITLKQYMQQKGDVLDWREALHFITQILKALSHAHSRGIIHRDIKPQNIMVLRDGSVKVADFGIARFTASQHTLTQEALGSVHYISPEQARGSHIDARSDIYSAGVVLYEMLTGRLPYEGDSPVAVAIQHINSIPLSPRELNPDIPEALEEITMKAMASNADQRYVDAEAMLADLEEFRKNPSINFDYNISDLWPDSGEDEPTQVIHTIKGHRPQEPEEPSYPRQPRQERERERRRGSGLPYVIGAVLAIAVFIFGMGYFLWTNVFSNFWGDIAETVDIPKLTGQYYSDVMADEDLNAQFQIVSGGTRASDNSEEGIILSQSPDAGTTSKDARPVITVIVSSGPEGTAESEYVEVPDVMNFDDASARSVLAGAGLIVTIEREYSSEITQNYAIRTEPMAHSMLLPGDSITLYISDGPQPEEITVISFVDQPLEIATSQAELMGLVVGTPVEVESEKEAGTVLFQSIAPETTVVKGTTINFQISKGPDQQNEQPVTEPPEVPTTRIVTVPLPYSDGMVTVRVEVGGEEQYNGQVSAANGSIDVVVKGTGIQLVDIFLDDALVDSLTLDFSE